MKRKIIFATKNLGKVREVSHIIGDKDFELLSLDDFNNVGEVIEDGKTFEENAIKKAMYFFDMFRIPILADDSGLVVEQLEGEPGVLSARYAGVTATDEESNQKLISKLLLLPKPHKAKFVCSAVFYDGKNMLKAEDEVVGQVIHEPRGTNGFGYDPIFLFPELNKTMAELPEEIKNTISHRAHAAQKACQSLAKRL